MTITSLGRGTSWGYESQTKRNGVFAGDLNQDIIKSNMNHYSNKDAAVLNDELREKQDRLDRLSSIEGVSPERKVERVQALQEEIQNLSNTYNQIRAFRIPEEMKENAERLAKAIQRAFPQPVVEEDEKEKDRLHDAANKQDEKEELTNQKDQNSINTVKEDNSPRITANIFERTNQIEEGSAQASGTAKEKERINRVREETTEPSTLVKDQGSIGEMENDNEKINGEKRKSRLEEKRLEEKRLEEKRLEDRRMEEKINERSEGNVNAEINQEESIHRIPKITDYIFDNRQSVEAANKNKQFQWTIEAGLTA